MLLDDQDRMLLLRYGPGQEDASETWWLPGGMVDEGESPWPAARREMGEETGIMLGSEPCFIGIDHRANVLGTGPVVDYFFAASLAAHRHTLIALHAAALSGRAAYLQEGMPT
ncbi:NUDIX hydrolase [Streptomyces sp. NBC_01351]|uniref:NUDIX hydrolase n=1 Tax=Streptomyces sp. NBC_01351 TaxID=2903833 RepID=UPI002E33388E|nr:NUDIX hydrolase [Streptomyces sp. NBC_01351]